MQLARHRRGFVGENERFRTVALGVRYLGAPIRDICAHKSAIGLLLSSFACHQIRKGRLALRW